MSICFSHYLLCITNKHVCNLSPLSQPARLRPICTLLTYTTRSYQSPSNQLISAMIFDKLASRPPGLPSYLNVLNIEAPVGRDNDTVLECGVLVRGEGDEPGRVVDDGGRGEAVARAELPAPVAADAEGAARHAVDAGLGRRRARHAVAAGRGRARVCVDSEGPRAGGVASVAGAHEALDCPLRDVSGRGHGTGGRGGREGGGGEEGTGEEGGELHLDGFVGWLVGCLACEFEWKWFEMKRQDCLQVC